MYYYEYLPYKYFTIKKFQANIETFNLFSPFRVSAISFTLKKKDEGDDNGDNSGQKNSDSDTTAKENSIQNFFLVCVLNLLCLLKFRECQIKLLKFAFRLSFTFMPTIVLSRFFLCSSNANKNVIFCLFYVSSSFVFPLAWKLMIVAVFMIKITILLHKNLIIILMWIRYLMCLVWPVMVKLQNLKLTLNKISTTKHFCLVWYLKVDQHQSIIYKFKAPPIVQ